MYQESESEHEETEEEFLERYAQAASALENGIVEEGDAEDQELEIELGKPVDKLFSLKCLFTFWLPFLNESHLQSTVDVPFFFFELIHKLKTLRNGLCLESKCWVIRFRHFGVDNFLLDYEFSCCNHGVTTGTLEEVDQQRIIVSLIGRYHQALIQGQALSSQLVSNFINAFLNCSSFFQ